MQLTPISYSVFNGIVSQILAERPIYVSKVFPLMLTPIDTYYLVYPAL